MNIGRSKRRSHFGLQKVRRIGEDAELGRGSQAVSDHDRIVHDRREIRMHGGLAVSREGDRVDGASLPGEQADALLELFRDDRARRHVGFGTVLGVEPTFAIKTVEGAEFSVSGQQIDA